MSDTTRTLRVFMVGTFAVVLRRNLLGEYTAVRILLPNTPRLTSGFDPNVSIPASIPFIGIPSQFVDDDNQSVLFRRKYQFPVMVDAGDPPGERVELAYFQLEAAQPLSITRGKTPFKPNFGGFNPNSQKQPTKNDCRFLEWSAQMRDYCSDYHVVHNDYLEDTVRRDAGFVEFDFGELSVARIGFKHRFRFIYGDDDTFYRAVADTLKLESEFDVNDIWIQINNDLRIKAQFVDGLLPLVIGSEPVEDISSAEPAHPCGEPYFHHELLFRFSDDTPLHPNDLATPVCVNIKRGSKDPRVGGCIPHALMSEPVTTLATVRAEEPPMQPSDPQTLALAIHIGVDEFSPNFPSSTEVPPLKSCATDARLMRRFAKQRRFDSLGSDESNVLIDSAATLTDVLTALREYGDALKRSKNAYFALTFSGHGYVDPSPKNQSDRFGDGWCLNTALLPYKYLAIAFRLYFRRDTRIMVICDCCHSPDLTDGGTGVKQVSVAVAEEAVVETKLFFAQNFLEFASLVDTVTPFDAASDVRAFDLGLDGPTVYFVFACGKDETIDDGPNKQTPSPFTQCVLDNAKDVDFTAFESALQDCSGKMSHIDRRPIDDEFEALGPFRLPQLKRLPVSSKSRRAAAPRRVRLAKRRRR
jgi:hypothetical protein